MYTLEAAGEEGTTIGDVGGLDTLETAGEEGATVDDVVGLGTLETAGELTTEDVLDGTTALFKPAMLLTAAEDVLL